MGLTLFGVLFPFFGLTASLFAAEDLTYFKAVDSSHPRCEDSVDLNAASEYFVELGNDVPGVHAYNEIVQLYQKQDWGAFEAKVEDFKKVYESSPLQEPLTYLYVQSKLNRIPAGDSGAVKETEQLFRQALLLYPKSQLAPVIYASTAAVWMKHGMYERALSLYEAAKTQYPFDSLACVFQTGVGESNYLLHNDNVARVAFELVLQKCANRRLRLTAEIRLAALEESHSKAAAYQVYEKMYLERNLEVMSLFPSLIANIAESKYQQKDYVKAKFFLKEYLKIAKRDPQCSAYAEKRLADIALRTGQKAEDVKGLYLEANQDYPGQDPGRMSRVLALLIDLKGATHAESERRLRLIDEDLDAMTDDNLRKEGYLLKGLALLDTGESSAVDYLVRLQGQSHFDLEKGPVASFVRQKIFSLLTNTVKNSDSLPVEQKGKHKESPPDPFTTLDTVFSAWFKGSNYVEPVQKLYADMASKQIGSYARQGNSSALLDLLKRWRSSPLFSLKEVRQNSGNIADSLLLLFKDSQRANRESAFLRDNQPLLRQFTSTSGNLLWAAVAMFLDNDKTLNKILKEGIGTRQPSSIEANDESFSSYVYLLKGQIYLKAKHYREAEAALNKIKDKEYLGQKLENLETLYEAQHLYAKAFYTAKQRVEAASEGDKVAALNRVADLVRRGKLWNRAEETLKLAEESKLIGKDLATFHFLSGKAQFEQGHFRFSAEAYQSALSLDGFSQDAAEGRYRLGKCFMKLKRPVDARRVWEELSKMKDPFWSGLAQNEIKLINP